MEKFHSSSPERCATHRSNFQHPNNSRLRKCARVLQKHGLEQHSPGEGWGKWQVLPMVPSCLRQKGPNQVTLLGPSQVPRSSCGALGLESTQPREPSSGPQLISMVGTLAPSHHPGKRPEFKIWAKGTHSIYSTRSSNMSDCQWR